MIASMWYPYIVDECPKGRSFFFAMKEFAKGFYTSMPWINTRRAYFKARGGLCERCLAKGLAVPAQVVHHKIHLTPENINDPNVTLNWDNLECLCKSCHTEEHQGVKRFSVDKFGHVTAK